MSVYYKIDGVDLGGPTQMPFPCPQEAQEKINDFICEADCVTVTQFRPGTHLIVDQVVKLHNASQFFCSFSNRVTPYKQITVYFK